jgi:hypothetical protein
MLTEYQAIEKVNQIIRQSGLGPEYVVNGVRNAKWGWWMEWMPRDNSKTLYGSSPYLVHKNGYIKESNDIAFRYKLRLDDINSICNAFVAEAEQKARQIRSV